jgi:hypothetical protein
MLSLRTNLRSPSPTDVSRCVHAHPLAKRVRLPQVLRGPAHALKALNLKLIPYRSELRLDRRRLGKRLI